MRSAPLLLALVACAGRADDVRMTPRPDTRFIAGVMLDGQAIGALMTAFSNNYPNEAARCLYGTIRDSTQRLVAVLGVDSANTFSATPRSVAFLAPLCPMPTGPWRLVGIGHDHLRTDIPCTHSSPDAVTLATHPEFLISVVFCPTGIGEVLWQDGRRVLFRYGDPEGP